MTRGQYLQEKLSKEEWDWVMHNELAIRNLMKKSEIKADDSTKLDPKVSGKIAKDEKLVLEATRALLDRILGKEDWWKTGAGTSSIYKQLKEMFKEFLTSSAKYSSNLRKLTRDINSTSNSFEKFRKEGQTSFSIKEITENCAPYFKDLIMDLYNASSGGMFGRNVIGKGEMLFALIFDDVYLDKHSNMKNKDEDDPEGKWKQNYGFDLITFDKDEVPIGIEIKGIGSRLDGNDFKPVYLEQTAFKKCGEKIGGNVTVVVNNLRNAIYPRSKVLAPVFSKSVIRNCWLAQNWSSVPQEDLADFLMEIYKTVYQTTSFANSNTEIRKLTLALASEIMQGNADNIISLDVLIRLIIYMQVDKNKVNRHNSFLVIFDEGGNNFYTISFGGREGDDAETVKKELLNLLDHGIWFETNGGTSARAIAPKIVKFDGDKKVIEDALKGNIVAPTPKENGGSKAAEEKENKDSKGGLLKMASEIKNKGLKESVSKDIYERVEMNASALFIGDICYALDDDIYRKVWGDQLGYEDGVVASGEEVYAVVGGTKYGDGEYAGSDGVNYGVDAGVIGVTNLTYMDPKESLESLRNLGTVVEVPSGKAEVLFRDEDGEFSITITDSESGSNLYYVDICTGETEEEYTCQNCGCEIDEWEYNRYGGVCESCYFENEEEEEEEDYEDEEE